MRKTMVLSVDKDMAEFIENQQGLVDPSALINKLFHEDMKRKGITVNPDLKSQMKNDEVLQELELFLDENTHAGE